MSMAMVLEATRDFLRSERSWTQKQCQIMPAGLPPATAGMFFITLDDGGVETAGSDNFYLREVFTIEVGVWRRAEWLAADLRGAEQLKTHPYLAGIQNLHTLERNVIETLHNNWTLRTQINTDFSLPSEDDGDDFTGVLAYTGRGRIEPAVLPEQNAPAFSGWRMRFKGLSRTQIQGQIK